MAVAFVDSGVSVGGVVLCSSNRVFALCLSAQDPICV